MNLESYNECLLGGADTRTRCQTREACERTFSYKIIRDEPNIQIMEVKFFQPMNIPEKSSIEIALISENHTFKHVQGEFYLYRQDGGVKSFKQLISGKGLSVMLLESRPGAQKWKILRFKSKDAGKVNIEIVD